MSLMRGTGFWAALGIFSLTSSVMAGAASDYWAFQPVRRPAVPEVAGTAAVAHPIDAFILARLHAQGLQPNGRAEPRELIRRLYFDLIGLPPTPEDVQAFLDDPSPAAYERRIDRLLALPQYGERWGRHWLDVVRFAQSNGYERDAEKPLAWKYRDYVIDAFNRDLPYDRFIKDQLAGDESENPTPASLVATGFLRLSVWDDEPDDKTMAEYDELDDILSTTGASFLGLTLGCARCHDHKFDPIPQSDYYQLLSFFRNVRPYEHSKPSLEASSYLPLATVTELKCWLDQQNKDLEALERELQSAPEEKRKAAVRKIHERPAPFDWALGVRERASDPPPTRVLIRGNPATPGAEVQPAFLTALGGNKAIVKPVNSALPSSGRRRALADWIASPLNPLTPRVLVNRVWQYHFGAGIVKTTTDFGKAGVPPTHPELLDWLAADFVENGWSIKKLHKQILLSQTYQRSSRATNTMALAADPGNDWLWRQNVRRLEAESLRDSLVAISGRINLAMHGRGFFPRLTGEVLSGASRPGLDWEMSPQTERERRSVYTFVRRTMMVPMLETFDYSNTASPLGERPVTTVAPQALLLLNDDFVREQADAFALRLVQERGSDQREQIRGAFQLALSRQPTPEEAQISERYLQRAIDEFNHLQSRTTFRPEAPIALEAAFMARMQAADFLQGPAHPWSYYRGRWSAAYESIRTMERFQGPFALWTNTALADGTWSGRILFPPASESAGLIVRAEPTGDTFRGYELILDAREQQARWIRHAEEHVTLAAVPLAIPSNRPTGFRITLNGARMQLWWNDSAQPVMETTDPAPIAEKGFAGIRPWGGPIHLDGLRFNSNEHEWKLAGNSRDPRQQALAAFCLMILNLNELIYID